MGISLQVSDPSGDPAEVLVDVAGIFPGSLLLPQATDVTRIQLNKTININNADIDFDIIIPSILNTNTDLAGVVSPFYFLYLVGSPMPPILILWTHAMCFGEAVDISRLNKN
jgi:hypothetical protein